MKTIIFWLAGFLLSAGGCSMGGGSYTIENETDGGEEVQLVIAKSKEQPASLTTKVLQPGQCVTLNRRQFKNKLKGILAGKGVLDDGGFGYKPLCGVMKSDSGISFDNDISFLPCPTASYSIQDEGDWTDIYKLVQLEKPKTDLTPCIKFNDWLKM